jgi:hypothetical protein
VDVGALSGVVPAAVGFAGTALPAAGLTFWWMRLTLSRSSAILGGESIKGLLWALVGLLGYSIFIRAVYITFRAPSVVIFLGGGANGATLRLVFFAGSFMAAF